MRDLKALFIPTMNSGVTYWRFFNAWVGAYRNRAFDAHVLWYQKDLNANHPWQTDITSNLHRARILGEMEAAMRITDVAVMGLTHCSAGLTTMMGLRECYGKPIVVEADDNILSCPTYNPASKFYNPDSTIRKIAVAQLREADAVVVSTPNLKEVYSEFNDHVYVVPNSIDFELWDRAPRKHHKHVITIGWMGGATHEADLDIVIPAIKELTAKYPQVRFSLLHGASKAVRDIKGVKVNNKFARIDQYPNYVASAGFDIGIAPLVDNAFNRAKSNLRWLEYSALAIPCVASNVGHFAETIHDGADGMLCDTPEDFTNALESLIIDKSKRRMMGNQAKERVFQDFNIDKTAERYGKILEEIRDRGQIKRTVPAYKDSNFKQNVEAV